MIIAETSWLTPFTRSSQVRHSRPWCPALPPRRTHSQRKCEEITVTAQLRTQSLQDVPLAIQVVDRALIEDVAAEDMSDLNGFVPGLVVSGDSPTQPRYQIRGIQTGDFGVGTDPAVGVYVDGIYAARSGASMLAFNDIERIEVLKGPQGTLFGRNSAAGAISIVTTQPSQRVRFTAARALRRVRQAVLRGHAQHAHRREARAAHQRCLQQERRLDAGRGHRRRTSCPRKTGPAAWRCAGSFPTRRARRCPGTMTTSTSWPGPRSAWSAIDVRPGPVPARRGDLPRSARSPDLQRRRRQRGIAQARPGEPVHRPFVRTQRNSAPAPPGVSSTPRTAKTRTAPT